MQWNKISKDVLISFFCAVFFLLWKGFLFNTADQIEPLVLVYKNLHPQLYVGDFYVDSSQDIFTVRYYYVALLSFLGKYFNLYYISLFLNFLCLFFSSLGLIKITRKITADQLTGYLTPFLVLFIFLNWTVGGNNIQYNLLISSTLAKAIAIWGVYFLMIRKWKLSAFLIGFCAWFQVLVGLQLGLIFITYWLFQKKWKVLWQWSIVWILAISPILIPVMYRQFLLKDTISGSDMTEFYQLLYVFRNPYHYLPSLFPLNAYIKLGVLFLIGNLCLYVFVERKIFYKIQIINFITILGLTIYSVSVSTSQFLGFGKIQWFKTTIILAAVSAIGISIAIEYLFKRFTFYRHINWIAVFCMVVFVGYEHLRYSTPFSLDHRTDKQKELSEIHTWIYRNTPLDAVFADYVDDEYFLCEAKRPLTIALNPIIHEPWFMHQWYQKFYQQYHVEKNVSDHVKMKVLANQYYESGKWISDTKVQYCILRKGLEFPKTKVVYSTENYQVLKFY